jgi:hypothetical protein
MNKLLFTVATAGLLLTVPAIAQNTNTQTQTTPSATSTQNNNNNNNAGRLQNDATQSKQEQRSNRSTSERSSVGGDRDERRKGREGFSTRSRSTVGVRIHEREEFRHGRGFRVHVRGPHCRTITVKTRHHHRVIVKHIRRCR